MVSCVDAHNSQLHLQKKQFDSLCVCYEKNSNSDKMFTDKVKWISYKLPKQSLYEPLFFNVRTEMEIQERHMHYKISGATVTLYFMNMNI